jgi:hypothetical protein
MSHNPIHGLKSEKRIVHVFHFLSRVARKVGGCYVYRLRGMLVVVVVVIVIAMYNTSTRTW